MKEPSWLDGESNRKRADGNDKKKAAKSNGEYRTNSNSGAGRTKLDLVGEVDAVETKFTEATSFRVHAKDIEKARRDVKRSGNRTGWFAMEITMRGNDSKPVKIVIIESSIYDMLRENWIGKE